VSWLPGIQPLLNRIIQEEVDLGVELINW